MKFIKPLIYWVGIVLAYVVLYHVLNRVLNNSFGLNNLLPGFSIISLFVIFVSINCEELLKKSIARYIGFIGPLVFIFGFGKTFIECNFRIMEVREFFNVGGMDCGEAHGVGILYSLLV